jgi:serpin B
VLLSCSKENDKGDQGPTIPQPIELKARGEQVIQSSNEFGLDIFRLIVGDEPVNKNIFISPTSISLALAMTWNGANNATEDSMAYALRLDQYSAEQINETFRDLIEGLTTVDEKVLLEIANSIWYRQDFTAEPDFLNINSTYYNAEVAALDFDSPEAVNTINNWVSDQTHERIPTVLDHIDPLAVMFLINALYFKGIWSIEFNKESTTDELFFLADGSQKTVDMMRYEEEIGYFENDLFQACEMNYGRGNFSMIVLLPKSDHTVADIADQLTPENWDNWVLSFGKIKVNLGLPKFTFKYEKKLNDILSLMGMGIAFEPMAADFTGINANGGLYIDFVKHNTFVEVNEEGTEAAAVTVVGVNLTSMPVDVRYMLVNRPFLFAIRETTTNTIVFMGKVAEPVIE